MEFIGLEEEAVSALQWQGDVVPGLLQTEDYMRALNAVYQGVDPTIPLSVHERLLQVRLRRQERLNCERPLQLSAVIDEAVLRRRMGSASVMRDQLLRIAEASEMLNVDLRILPLDRHPGLVSGSYVIMRFGSLEVPDDMLGDVVSTEGLRTEIYVEDETDTRIYSIFFGAMHKAALTPDDSRRLLLTTINEQWS